MARIGPIGAAPFVGTRDDSAHPGDVFQVAAYNAVGQGPLSDPRTLA